MAAQNCHGKPSRALRTSRNNQADGRPREILRGRHQGRYERRGARVTLMERAVVCPAALRRGTAIPALRSVATISRNVRHHRHRQVRVLEHVHHGLDVGLLLCRCRPTSPACSPPVDTLGGVIEHRPDLLLHPGTLPVPLVSAHVVRQRLLPVRVVVHEDPV